MSLAAVPPHARVFHQGLFVRRSLLNSHRLDRLHPSLSWRRYLSSLWKYFSTAPSKPWEPFFRHWFTFPPLLLGYCIGFFSVASLYDLASAESRISLTRAIRAEQNNLLQQMIHDKCFQIIHQTRVIQTEVIWTEIMCVKAVWKCALWSNEPHKNWSWCQWSRMGCGCHGNTVMMDGWRWSGQNVMATSDDQQQQENKAKCKQTHSETSEYLRLLTNEWILKP